MGEGARDRRDPTEWLAVSVDNSQPKEDLPKCRSDQLMSECCVDAIDDRIGDEEEEYVSSVSADKCREKVQTLQVLWEWFASRRSEHECHEKREDREQPKVYASSNCTAPESWNAGFGCEDKTIA